MKRKVFSFMTVLLFSILLPTSLVAQTEKGHFIVDGDIGGTFSSFEAWLDGNHAFEGKHTDLQVDLRFGYTFLDNLEVGIGLGISYEKFTGDLESTSNGFEYDLFMRYYFLSGKKLKPFVAPHVGFYHFDTDARPEGKGFEYGVAVGFAYFLNNHVGIDVACDLTRRRTEQDTPTYDLSKNTYLRIAFGLIYSF